MTIDKDDLLNSILTSISRIDYIKAEEIPEIDLYMDQVTTFMEAHLKSSKRYEEDKVLTKTMINNYAKNNLLPPPVKKKYSKEHVMLLTFIYYMKNILSISDIQKLLGPISRKYFDAEEELDMEGIYNQIVELEMAQVKPAMKDISKRYHLAEASFLEAEEEDKEFLQYFSFICLLCFDVYVKKQLVEKLIDELPREPKDKK